RLNRVGATDGCRARLGEAEVLHLSLLNEGFDSSRHVLNRHFGINAMLIEKIDGFDLQAREGCVGDLPDVVRPAVETITRAVQVNAETKLGGNDYFGEARRQRFTHQFFVRERTIRLGSIEKRYPT